MSHSTRRFAGSGVKGCDARDPVSGVEVVAVVALPKWRKGSRVGVAVAFVFTATAALLADAGTVTAAQGRLQAEYVATVAGVQVGHGNWFVDISDSTYTAMASGATAGVLTIFSGAHGTGSAQGTIADGHPVPQSYNTTIMDNRQVDAVRIALANGNVTTYSAEPPLVPRPDRVPVTDADRRGVVDPMTSALTHVDGNGDPVSPEACQRKIAVFDGRIRYDLTSRFKRMDVVKAERGYAGPAVVCALYFTPVAGHVPNRSGIRYLIELRDAEVWLAPIAGTRMLVPFRFSMPTPLGEGILLARQFISVAEPAQAAAAPAAKPRTLAAGSSGAKTSPKAKSSTSASGSTSPGASANTSTSAKP